MLENLPLSPWKTPSRDPTDWLTDGATLVLVAALIQMIAGAGFESLQSPPTDGGLPTNRRVDGDVDGGLSFEKKVEEYLKMKNARKRGEFNDEIDLDETLYQDYYQDFDVEGDVDDNDNFSFYDYYDFIANTEPGKLEGDTSTGSTGGGTEDAMRFKQEQKSQRRRMISRQLLKQQLLMAKKRQRQFLIAKKQQQMLAANRQLQQQQQQQLQKQKQVRAALARRFLALSQKALLAKSRSQGRVGIVRPRPRVRVVNGYLRPKAPLLGYIRPALANRIYDVAYPYGVGGDTLLDRVAVDFDPWLTSAVIGYFFQRFVAGPFGIPSITDLLGQAVGAVGRRDVDGRRHSS